MLGAGGSGLVGSRGSAQSSLRTSLCTASCGHRHAAERSVGIRRGCAAGAAAISATRVPSKRMGTFRALRNSNWLKLSAKRLRCPVAARNTTATERCAAFPRKGAVQIYFPCSALTTITASGVDFGYLWRLAGGNIYICRGKAMRLYFYSYWFCFCAVLV